MGFLPVHAGRALTICTVSGATATDETQINRAIHRQL
jgi:hypothetical protein